WAMEADGKRRGHCCLVVLTARSGWREVERADAASHGRVAWSCLDWTVLLAGSWAWTEKTRWPEMGWAIWGRWPDLGRGAGRALITVDGLLSPARWAKGATLLMGLSWPSSSSLPTDGSRASLDRDGVGRMR
ncbi:hypothetical protein ACLOJK_037224, partial [Asimina triloba]